MPEQQYFYAVGRRKCAVARVRLMTGDGHIFVNGKTLEEYFQRGALESIVQQPMEAITLTVPYNAVIKVVGGGLAGQAGAIRQGIARALVVLDEELRPTLRKAGFLTRDARVKERKKYGLKRARKAPQYTKR